MFRRFWLYPGMVFSFPFVIDTPIIALSCERHARIRKNKNPTPIKGWGHTKRAYLAGQASNRHTVCSRSGLLINKPYLCLMLTLLAM